MKRIIASLLVLALLLTGCASLPDTPTDPSEPTTGGSVNATDGTDDPTNGTEIPTDGPDGPTDGTETPTDGPDDPTEAGKDTFYSHFIDVGQADCALLKVGDCDILIDGGNVDDGPDVVAYLQSQNVDDIELMICTHADEDHVGGLTDVLNSFAVEEVWTSPVSKTTKAYTNFVNAVSNEGVALTVPTVGDTYTYEDLTVTTLGPVAKYSSANNASVVVMVQYGKVRFLFTGDMEKDAEADLLASGADLRCDVLKVGHHGSDTSSTADFIRAVGASYGVISVGAGNSYGHPHAAILTRLENAGMKLYRTDELGTVIIATDGKDLFFPDGSTSSGGGFEVPDVPTPTQPEETAPSETEPEVCFIGHKTSKKLHLPTCSSLPSEANRVYFDSYDEAIDEGYIPCKICMKNYTP